MTIEGGAMIGLGGTADIQNGFDLTSEGTGKFYANENQAHIAVNGGSTVALLPALRSPLRRAKQSR